MCLTQKSLDPLKCVKNLAFGAAHSWVPFVFKKQLPLSWIWLEFALQSWLSYHAPWGFCSRIKAHLTSCALHAHRLEPACSAAVHARLTVLLNEISMPSCQEPRADQFLRA